MKLFLISSFAIISTIMLVTPSLAFAQDPFTIGKSGYPFAVGGGGGGNAPSANNITLGIRSDTDWSGTYGDSTGSTTVDGHGNKDFIFSCSKTYSAMFQKKGQGTGFLTLNIVQPFNLTVHLAPTTLNSVTITPGGSANASRQINDTARFIGVVIHVESNSSNAMQTQGLSNVTLKESVRNPNGIIMSNNNFTEQFLTTFKPDIAGKYTLRIYNLGDRPVSLGALLNNIPPQTTVTTHNMTNTRTTTAQFGTVSVSGSC
jgi:hypothetical protein